MSQLKLQNMAKEYLERQIMNASPVERIVLCYDGAIKFLSAAKRAIEEGNIQERYNNNKKAGDVIAYLMDTLNMEKGGEVAERLRQVYSYMLRRLMDVDLKNDVLAIDEVVAQLRDLRASWEKVARGDLPSNNTDEAAPKDDELKAQKPISAMA